MIIRSIVFHYGDEYAKRMAIELAKNLHGYVDVENLLGDTKHLDITTYHYIVVIDDKTVKQRQEVVEKLTQLFGEGIKNKRLYMIIIEGDTSKEYNYYIQNNESFSEGEKSIKIVAQQINENFIKSLN